MRITKCDVCERQVDEAVRVEVLDGEHPHNGSEMTKTIDCCLECIFKFEDLSSRIEYSDLLRLK